MMEDIENIEISRLTNKLFLIGVDRFYGTPEEKKAIIDRCVKIIDTYDEWLTLMGRGEPDRHRHD